MTKQNVAVFVRHGQSFGNVNGAFLTLDEINFLTEEGVRQAAAIQLPAGLEYARFIASANRRAQQTLVMMMSRLPQQSITPKQISFTANLNEARDNIDTGTTVRRRSKAAVKEIKKALEHGNVLVAAHNWIMADIFKVLGFRLPQAAFEHAPIYANRGDFFVPYIIRHCHPIIVPRSKFK